MKRNAQGEAGRSSLFLPMTQIHFPTLPHPDFAGKTGAGDIGDAMAEMDHNVGVILDAIARLGHRAQHDRASGCTDNGAEFSAAVARHVGPVARVLHTP